MLFDNESELYPAVINIRGCSIANHTALNLFETLLDIFSVTLRFFRCIPEFKLPSFQSSSRIHNACVQTVCNITCSHGNSNNFFLIDYVIPTRL